MKMNLYSKTYQRKIRIISLITMSLIFGFSGIEIYHFQHPVADYTTFMIIGGLVINLLSIFLNTLIIIFPTRFGIFGIITMIYGLWILYFNPENPIPFFLFYISLTTLVVRGFFRKFKNIKVVLMILFFVAALMYPLKSGFLNFIKILIQNFACIFCMVAERILLTMNANIKDSKKILKLSEYEGLRERDCDWLKRIQSGEKYQKIAIEYNLSQGTIKNRLKEIYEILEVGDKTGFLTRYSESEILY